MELNKIQLTGIITMAILLSGTVVYEGVKQPLTYDPSITYYCQSRDIVMECTKGLSASKITCYSLDSKGAKIGKQCSEGWKIVSDYLPETPSETPKLPESNAGWHWDKIDGETYLCSNDICILHGDLRLKK